MKLALCILLWLVLLAASWPLALAALLIVPVVWLASLPVRLVVWVVEAVLALARGILFLPARLLGFRG